METACGLVKFIDLNDMAEVNEKPEENFGILFSDGSVMCLCCGGIFEPDDRKIVADYSGFDAIYNLLRGSEELLEDYTDKDSTWLAETEE